MITSRLTSKARTTIPQAVRTALNLKPGDEIAYAIEDGKVMLTRAETKDNSFATFSEWNTKADAEAYGDL